VLFLLFNAILSGQDITQVGYIQANNVDIDVGSLSVPVVNDWNEDGKKDLIVGSDTGYIYLYLNQGTNAAPVFNEEYELTDYQVLIDPVPGSYNWCHFEVCDWNEDSHVDLLYTKWESEIKVHLHGNHHIGCLAEPINPPINIPSQGGSFSCSLTLSNSSSHDIFLDAWTDAVLPNGALYGPVREKADVTLPAGATWRFTISEYVPGYVQTGLFSYNLCVGKMGSGCFVIDGFNFTKL